MGISARHRLAAFAVAVSATFSTVWAMASHAYPAGAAAPAVQLHLRCWRGPAASRRAPRRRSRRAAAALPRASATAGAGEAHAATRTRSSAPPAGEPDRRAQAGVLGDPAARQSAERPCGDGEADHRRDYPAAQRLRRRCLPQRQVIDEEHHAAEIERGEPTPKITEASTAPPPAAPTTSHATPVPSRPASSVGPKPKRRLSGSTAPAAPSEPSPASIHKHADVAWREAELAHRDSTTSRSTRGGRAADGDRPRERAQRGVVPDLGEPLADLGADAAPVQLRRIARPGGMPRRIHAETKNENESSRMAKGAVSHWISAPRAPARSTAPTESLMPIFAFASARRSRPTRSVMNTGRPAPMTAPVPMRSRRRRARPSTARRATRTAARPAAPARGRRRTR